MFFFSDDSFINDVINECLTACKRHSIDHYHKKTLSDINDMETICESDESKNKDIDVSFIETLFNIKINDLYIWRVDRETIVGP